MSDPLAAETGAVRIAAAVRAGEVSAVAVVEATLARIGERDRAINAFTAVAAARARARARVVDTQIRAGVSPGPFAGVPFGVKAMMDVAGLATSAGSAMHRGDPPAIEDAEVVRRLERAGAICVGALNMDEFGMGGTTENACFGVTRNPHDMERTPGGSSGGSAAALAAGLVPFALGADGLGSIRLPASLCGVYGLRPTLGSMPSAGQFGDAGSIGTVGPMARSVRDVVVGHALLAGRDVSDFDAPEADDDPDFGSLRLARAGGYFAERLDADAAEAVDRAVRALDVIRVVDFPQAQRARAAAMLIHTGESASGMLEALRTCPDRFDPLTRDRFLAHALMPAQWYLQAQRFRRWHAGEVAKLFHGIDVLLLPATPCIAPLVGARSIRIDGLEVPTGPALGCFAQPLAGTGCPAFAVPIERPGKLPMGIQLLAARGREDLLFRVAAQLERLGVARAEVATPAGFTRPSA